MDVFLWILGIAGLACLLIAGFFLWKGKGTNQPTLKWWGMVAGSIAALVIALMGLGRKRKPEVVTLDGHKRKTAPSEKEKAEVDTASDEIDKQSEEQRKKEKLTDRESEILSRDKLIIDKKVKETDREIQELQNKKSGRESSLDSSDAPDPSVSSRLRNR